MNIKVHKNIFLAFFRAGMLGYGGGLSAIPLMQREVVLIYKWMDDEEFSDVLALANTLPGPINTKLSGYIGYKIGGSVGLIIALIATVLPTALLMILLLTTLNAYKDKEWVQGMSMGVLPIAGVMIGILARNFIFLSKKLMGWKPTIILTIISVLAMEALGLHPAILILILIVAALFSKEKDEFTDSNEKQQGG